jgi:hypothetical protein
MEFDIVRYVSIFLMIFRHNLGTNRKAVTRRTYVSGLSSRMRDRYLRTRSRRNYPARRVSGVISPFTIALCFELRNMASAQGADDNPLGYIQSLEKRY